MRARGGARLPPVLVLLALLAGCSPAIVAFSAPCNLTGPLQLLPPEARESSGLVASRIRPGHYWTHGDGPGQVPLLFLDSAGGLLESVWLDGVSVEDWEDLSIGPCEPREEGSCLYVADTGDNGEERDDAAIYRVQEPLPGAERTEPAERFSVTFPDGPRDVEAMFLLPGERLFLVTKGRNHPVELYRVPPLPSRAEMAPRPGASGLPLLLDRIQLLTEGPPPLPRWVTGGSASPDGRFVALRTYETLQFYEPDASGRLSPMSGGLINLRTVGEIQGEGVAFASGADVVLTSEAGPLGGRASIATLRCAGAIDP